MGELALLILFHLALEPKVVLKSMVGMAVW